MTITVPRNMLVEHFQKLGFVFLPETQQNGQPRILGHTLNDYILIELVGPPEDVITMTITGKIIPNDTTQSRTIGVLMSVMVALFFPDWKDDGQHWLAEHLRTIRKTVTRRFRLTRDGYTITIQWLSKLPAVTLAFEKVQTHGSAAAA